MLPIDIEEQVLDHLHDDIDALKACSLTCSAWLPTTRLHLFRVVRLTCQRDCQRFLRTLESTSIANGGVGVGIPVRELHLPRMALCERRGQAGLCFALLSQILNSLPNGDTLVIQGVDWRTLVELLCAGRGYVYLRQAVASVFRFPHLKNLRLQSVCPESALEVLQFICAFPSLHTLELWNVTFHSETIDDDTIPQSENIQICIQELIIDMWGSSLQLIQSILKGLL